ncbi:MAG: hypothetical protein GY941_05610 [Planctomycetes bacterium]|nr:hypothetical protein [Planctomycetota bacterium]
MKSKLELKLLLQDVEFFSSRAEETSVSAISTLLRHLQYNGLSIKSPNYVTSLMNVMLYID